MNIVKCMKFEMDYIKRASSVVGTHFEPYYIKTLFSLVRDYDDLKEYLFGCTLHDRKVKEIKISNVCFKEKVL